MTNTKAELRKAIKEKGINGLSRTEIKDICALYVTGTALVNHTEYRLLAVPRNCK